jgi:predicted RNA-binding protein YlqC (UPF0109 family)
MATSIDQQFVEYVVKSLVGNPDAVQIERRIDEKGVLLELTVDPEDLGRVIGKRGATAQSIRTLLRALGTKNEARYNLKIVDNDRPGYDAEARRAADTAPAASDDTAAPAAAADDPTAGVTKPQNDDLDEDDTAVSDKEVKESDVIRKTREELKDLDDLDI